MTQYSQASPGPPPFQEAERFLRLLADICQMQQQLLEDTRSLRARVAELEARIPGADRAGRLS